MIEARNLLQLESGALELQIAPTLGGCVARFDYRSEGKKWSIFRGSEGFPETILDAASFPLVPYCNRIRGGTFRFRGRRVTIARNMDTDASPLHGHGWLAPWSVTTASKTMAELHLRHEPGEWPWRYEARQGFELDGGGLTLRLACRNLSKEPMPCGLGQHPYFLCTPETRLDTGVTAAWTIDDKVLPVEKVVAAGRYDLRDRLVCGQDLDNGFGGWGRVATIGDPALPFAIVMSSPDADFFQLYSPASGALFVAEPVTHANAAMNEPEESWPELGLRVLGPGEEMVLSTRFEIVPKG